MRPLTAATIATCGQPPMRRVHCMTTAGSPPSTDDVVGALQAKRRSSDSRHGPDVATLINDAPLAGPLARTRAAGCCQVPQSTSTVSGEPDGNWLQLSP